MTLSCSVSGLEVEAHIDEELSINRNDNGLSYMLTARKHAQAEHVSTFFCFCCVCLHLIIATKLNVDLKLMGQESIY